MERFKVYQRIDVERNYQDLRWRQRDEKKDTPDEDKPPAEWVNYMEFHLNKGKEKIYYLHTEEALAEIRKVVALGIRCLEIHGCPERDFNADLLKNG